jgi:DNA-binding transcriptional MerR regulator
MTEEEYMIGDLARRAGISVRTVRYYIQEGLLPAPPSRGRYTIYSEEYLKRLKLIQLLKDAFMPLKEIKHQVGSLDMDGVEELLSKHMAGNLPLPTTPAPARRRSREKITDDAASYASKVLRSQAILKEELRDTRSRSTPTHKAARGNTHWKSLGSRYRCVQLAQDLELHVGGRPDPEKSRKIQQLVDLAEHLFGLPGEGKR